MGSRGREKEEGKGEGRREGDVRGGGIEER